jgi:two-component system sensor histidine kinase KdpD
LAFNDNRLDPDDVLKAVSFADRNAKSAKLRVFLGMSAGVGKTYSMLRAARQRLKEGVDVVVGLAETHGRQETAELLEGLPILPRRKMNYRGASLEEMDLDTILKRRPELVIVDELAHTNVAGSRHEKRYQDVLEILDAGIDVYTALNVQHLESRKDAVEAITGVPIRETVPDSILERASLVELVDIAPSELLKRLREGKVYLGDKAQRAIENFFKEDHLTALREIALRITAERVDQDLQRIVSVRPEASAWRTTERLMVAISHSPYSEFLIRATRRLAYSLEAPWIAVHIDTGEILHDQDQAQLAKNLNLARELRAEVVTTTETDVPTALRRVARQKNVTQVVLGRSSKHWLRDFIGRGSVLDKLVREAFEFDVHIVRQETVVDLKPRGWEGFGRLTGTSGPLIYWNVFWIFFGVSFLSGLIEPYIGYRTVGFLFLLAVMAIGLFASIGPVFFAATLSASIWNYFFIPPRMTFVIRSADDLILCFSYFVVALITGFLTSRVRLHERIIREREERTNFLYEILQEIAGSQDQSEYLNKVVDRVGALLKAECGIILKGLEGKLYFADASDYALRLSEKEQAVATWAFQNGKAAGWSTDTLSQSKSLYLPLKGLSEILGVFVFRPDSNRKMSLDQENLLDSVARQLGVSLERTYTSKRLLENQKLKESEELHQTLLNSISHELRTPLTAILGTVSVLEDDKIANDPASVKSVAGNLQEAGDRLNQVIENLLDMSRLNSGVLSLNLEWHDWNDLIGVVLKKTKRSLDHHKIKVQIPENVRLVKIDFRLIEHAISNLILNAVMYSPEGTEIGIQLSEQEGKFRLVIEDQGPGIPEASLDKIFDKFYRVPGSPPGGTGLGLSIVKSIIEFHKGVVRVENKPVTGTRFVIEIPIENMPSLPEDV